MATLEELKRNLEKSSIALQKALDKKNRDANLHWEALLEHNRALPDGFYVESSGVLAGDFPVYLKSEGQWLAHNGIEFADISWLDAPADFDVEVISINEVKF
jgi:hypothetical protein